MAACRGLADVSAAEDLFLILGAAIQGDVSGTEVRGRRKGNDYFLKRLSNAARASLALRGAATMLG
jgi:hypothetical protein